MYMCIFACLFQDDPLLSRYKRLNEVIVGVVEDYSLVNFIPLNVQVTTQSLFIKHIVLQVIIIIVLFLSDYHSFTTQACNSYTLCLS